MSKPSQAKIRRLGQIKAEIIAKNVCPDLAKQATQLVFGDGNPEAEIVFIGEAPGKNEDLQGLPFVGAAGKFLNEMLGMIDLKREDIYITNIVKYRPPNNRDPLPIEKAAFLPFLQVQLAVIQPKVVVTLGRHSLNCFLPDLQISAVHGEPKRFNWILKRTSNTESNVVGAKDDSEVLSNELSIVLLPLFHPAAALYNGGMRQTLIDDFIKIPIIIKKLQP